MNGKNGEKFFDAKQLASINKYKIQTERYMVQEVLRPIDQSQQSPVNNPDDICPHPDFTVHSRLNSDFNQNMLLTNRYRSNFSNEIPNNDLRVDYRRSSSVNHRLRANNSSQASNFNDSPNNNIKT